MKRMMFALPGTTSKAIKIAAVFFCLLALAIGFGLSTTRVKGVLYAAGRIAPCFLGASNGAQTCYNHVFSRLYPTLSIPEIFDLIRLTERIDPRMGTCHFIAHDLARDLLARDPSTWVDALALQPTDGLCSLGFIHGVAIAAFKNHTLTPAEITAQMPTFKGACEPHGNFAAHMYERTNCYHGLGHMLYYVTGADIDRSMELCKQVAQSRENRTVCYGGVSMPLYLDTDEDGFAIKVGNEIHGLTLDTYEA